MAKLLENKKETSTPWKMNILFVLNLYLGTLNLRKLDKYEYIILNKEKVMNKFFHV